MKKNMFALVAHAPFDYRYEEIPIPEIGPGEILLKVKACGICAGDLKAYHGGIRIWGTSEENRYIDAPITGGHEFCGTICEKAPDVTTFEIGDTVISEQIVPCGHCRFCTQGKYWMCTGSAVFGFKKHCAGGFAEYVKLPATCINHKVPEQFTLEEAVLVEPIACGMHAVEKAQIKHSDTVVIAGMGAIGLSMINLVQLCLPKMIIGIDVRQSRLAAGKNFGADLVLNPADCNVAEEIHKRTDGLGCDVYIEASGSPKSVRQGMDSLINLGRFIQMGVFAEEVTADWNVIGDGKEMQIIGSHLSALTYPAVIRGIQNKLIKTDGLVSHRFKLQDWKQAFETAEKAPDAMKVILIP